METRNHFKNGAKPKSQMSRIIKLNKKMGKSYFKILFVVFGIILTTSITFAQNEMNAGSGNQIWNWITIYIACLGY
jgi:hypothetical protein